MEQSENQRANDRLYEFEVTLYTGLVTKEFLKEKSGDHAEDTGQGKPDL